MLFSVRCVTLPFQVNCQLLLTLSTLQISDYHFAATGGYFKQKWKAVVVQEVLSAVMIVVVVVVVGLIK